MTTRTMCCYLHGERPGQIHGGPFGTGLSALFDDDTHDVLLFARKTPGRNFGRPVAGRLVRDSLHFLMTTRTMYCYLHGKRPGQIHGGPFGTGLSALFDDDTHDVLLFARKTPRRNSRPRREARLVWDSLHFLMTTLTMYGDLHGKRAGRTQGGRLVRYSLHFRRRRTEQGTNLKRFWNGEG
jgi:hypothetical protein